MAKIHGLLEQYTKDYKVTGYKLNAPSPTERGETAVMTELNKAFHEIGKPVTVTVGKYKFVNIVGVNKVFGTPKADVALVQWSPATRSFTDVCFISHKMGSAAKDFQQYSGISTTADGSKPGAISKDSAVVEFLQAISSKPVYNAIVKDKKRFGQIVKSPKLIGKAVYGPEFGSTKLGIDNIHCIGQGNPKLQKGAGAYSLSFTGGMHLNGDTRPFMSGEYQAVVGARYTAGRQFEVAGKIFRDVRVLVIPRVVLGGSTVIL
jgi:hypothetical protein